MKAFITILFSLISVSAHALTEGYYEGKNVFKDKVEMHVKANPARPDSHLVLIVNEGGYGFIYQADKYAEGTYGLIPLVHRQENMVTVKNPNPSLTLKMTMRGSKKFIQVLNNGNGNDYGFKFGSMSFDVSKRKKPMWANAFPGVYQLDSRHERVLVSKVDGEKDLSLVANTTILNGDYVLREVRGGVYLALRNTLSMAGVDITDGMEGMIVFIERKNVLGKNGLYILNYIGTVRPLEFKRGGVW